MMNAIISKKSIFTAMLQNGPFAVGDTPPVAHPFSTEAKEWVKAMAGDPLMKTKYRAVRNQIFDFLSVSTFDEILSLIHEKELRKKNSGSAHQLLGNMFGIRGDMQVVDRHLHDYAGTADDVVNSLRAKVLAPYSSHVETTNEIETMHDPVALLLVLFDERFHRKARFEAKRKLVLMGLAGSIDQRERETQIEEKFAEFLGFLNEFVWSPSLKIGDLEICYLHSRHSAEDFRCLDVKVLSEGEALAISPTAGEKLTLTKRRSFSDQVGEVPIYVTIRKKPPAAKSCYGRVFKAQDKKLCPIGKRNTITF